MNAATIAPSLVAGTKLLSILLTYRCTAACTDCGTFSGPLERTHVDLEAALSAISQARDAGFEAVVFTGGEPMMRRRELLICLDAAREAGLVSRIVTNGYWAKNERVAAARIAELVDHGLAEINVSTGDEHVRFVNVDLVARAVGAAARAGLVVAIMVEIHSAGSVTASTYREHPLIAALPAELASKIRIAESPWMPVDPSQPREYPPGVAVTRQNVASRSGCSSVLSSYTLQADDSLTACCGLGVRTVPELRLHARRPDNTPDLAGAIAEAESDIMKLLLHYVGPEKILAWASEKNPDITWEGTYAHTCHACLRLYHDPMVRETIRDHYEELLTDLVGAIAIDEVMLGDHPGAPTQRT